MCGRAGQRKVELPPAAIELMIAEPEFDPESVEGSVIAHFCQQHWETVTELVEDRGVNPLVRCFAENIEQGQGGTLAERNLNETISRANAETRGVRHTLGRQRSVESKLVLWTLDATSSTDNENLRRLEQRLVEQLAGQGHHVFRCAESEEGDLIARIRGDSGSYLFAFKIIGVSPADREVFEMGYETTLQVDLSARINPFHSFARRMGAIPLLAIQWADDPRFFFHDLQREAESITIQEPVMGGFFFEDIQFTPLPTAYDLPEAVTEDRWEAAVKRRRSAEASRYDLQEKLFQYFR